MGGAAKATIDHDFIQKWVEERGGKPSHVKGRGGPGDPGILRIDFPGFSGEGSLEEISWDEWFKAFDENNLAFLFQESTSGGQQSRFNKLVSRDSVDPKDVYSPGEEGEDIEASDEEEGEEERAEEEEEEEEDEEVEASEEEDENIEIEVSDEMNEAVASGEQEGDGQEPPRSQRRASPGRAPEQQQQQKKRRAS